MVLCFVVLRCVVCVPEKFCIAHRTPLIQSESSNYNDCEVMDSDEVVMLSLNS